MPKNLGYLINVIGYFCKMKFNLSWILCVLVLASCNDESKELDVSKVSSFTCDAESTILEDGSRLYTTSNEGLSLKVGETQSDDFSRSGNYSAKLDSTNQYVFGCTLTNFNEGDYLRFSVWEKVGNDKAVLTVTQSGEGFSNSINSSFNYITVIEDGWMQHNVSLIVSEGVEEITASIFGKGYTSYFDDFQFRRLDEIPKGNFLPELNLQVDEKNKIGLKKSIAGARKGKVIANKYKKYFKGEIFDQEEVKKMKFKLKGDWLDHLSSGKVSLRIKMRGNTAYHGLKTFSIQHAKTRGYLDEWLVHKLAEDFDVLATKFEFVNVSLNQKNFGVYALEEHFDKQLLEQRNRREGPILKLDESGVWQLSFAESDQVKLIDFPYYEASKIDVFKTNRTLKTESLRKNYEEACKLLTLFKNGHAQIEDVFDIDQLARYYVILDLCGGFHASAWHNRRFYFNPVTQKLEHILYDIMPFTYGNYFVNSIEHSLPETKRGKDVSLTNAVMLNREFKEKYMAYLEEMTRKEYLDTLFFGYKNKIDTLTAAIQVEEPYYNLNLNRYYQNAAHMQRSLKRLDELWETTLKKNLSPSDWVVDKTYSPREDTVFFEGVSLNAYLNQIDSNNFEVTIENYHLNEITLCGYERDNWPGQAHPLDNQYVMAGYQKEAAQQTIQFDSKPSRLFFTVSNKPGRYYEVKMTPWQKPNGISNRMELYKADKTIPLPYVIIGDKAVFNRDVIIERLVYIPKKYTVEIKPGVSICLANGGGIIVNNNFTAVGTASAPIKVFSIDGTSNGLTILNADNTRIEYAEFCGLSNLHYKNWTLTGGLTIYESDVSISHIEINNALSEDGLNIIRSHFEINDLSIDGTLSDGFDADFCTGTLSNSSFNNTGNDCVDFSGSQIDLNNINIENSGDKGVSGGERSYLYLTDININGAITGVASKDQSILIGENIKINDVNYGIMVFQKKAEYGSASLNFTKTEIENADTLYLVDKGAVFSLNGDVIEGKIKLDIDQLYSRFEK